MARARCSALCVAMLVASGFVAGVFVAPCAGTEAETVTPTDPGPDWGTDVEQVYTVHAASFVPFNSAVPWTLEVFMGQGVYKYANGPGSSGFFAPLSLPSGASVAAIEIDGCDEDAVWELVWGLGRDPRGPTQGGPAGYSSSQGTPGCATFRYGLVPEIGINNYSNSYFLEVGTQSNNSGTRFKAFRVYYRLRVSPKPGVATFLDVPLDFWAFQHVEALAASGITAGCGGGNFCPGSPLTRAEMAVFLAKALGLHWAP